MEPRELVDRHNKKVSEELERAENGETINLTELMISKEKIVLNIENL